MSARLTDIAALWAYLTGTPLLALALTLVAYLVGDWLAERTGRHPAVHPVLLAIVIVGAVLSVGSIPYDQYFSGAQFVHFLLGPATVALAVPLWHHREEIARQLLPILVALAGGALAGVLSAVLLARALGLDETLQVALAPKSVTAGIAMALSEGLGGAPALTAAFVIMTGILGAIMVTPLMDRLGLKDYAARGFAAGLAAHGIGTARAFRVDPLAGTFAGVALALNGIATALLLPLLAPWLFGSLSR